jgi:hypothetical protein
MKYLLIIVLLVLAIFPIGCDSKKVVYYDVAEECIRKARTEGFELGIAVAHFEILKRRNYLIDSDSLKKICIRELSKMNINRDFQFR